MTLTCAGRPPHGRSISNEATTMTFWINEITGEQLDAIGLRRLQAKAREVYAHNAHIFEDELDALAALGAVPTLRPTQE